MQLTDCSQQNYIPCKMALKLITKHLLQLKLVMDFGYLGCVDSYSLSYITKDKIN